MSTSYSGCLPCYIITTCILLSLCLWRNKYDDDDDDDDDDD